MTTGGIAPEVQLRLDRLVAIGQHLQGMAGTLALLALGSLGLETERADRHSDLDFFIIAEADVAPGLRSDLAWLAAVSPIVFDFPNTPDGSKVLFADGIFAEFAVFTPDQLPTIPFSPGRVIWARDDFAVSSLTPARQPVPVQQDWAVLEALTCLFVGLGRFRRGELLAAHRMIQGHALDLTLSLLHATAGDQHSVRALPDAFAPARRVETAFPDKVAWLAEACAGYGQSDRSAQAILTELARLRPLPPALATAIEALLQPYPDA